MPAEILARRDKVGFEPPQRAGSPTRGCERIAEVLLDPTRARRTGRRAAIEPDVSAGLARPVGVWRALNAELWLRTFERAPVGTATTVAAARPA